MKILVTGSNGLVGHALRKELTGDVFFATRKDGDLTKEKDVENLYREINPEIVIHAGALCGGIGGNLNGPANYFYENVLMNTYMIHYAWKYNVKKLLAFSSVCVFPENIPVLKEDLMHQGEPFYSQFAYAAAKRGIDTQIRAYKSQYGITNYCSIIPGNIFGEHDYYNLTSGHVLPSLIHKVFMAKKEKKPLKVWGTGEAKREFIYSKDLARMINQIIQLDEIPERIIISNNDEISIKDLVNKLCEVSNFKGEVIWEVDKPNGQMSRPSNLSLLKSLIETKYTNREEALKSSYEWFENNYPNVRM